EPTAAEGWGQPAGPDWAGGQPAVAQAPQMAPAPVSNGWDQPPPTPSNGGQAPAWGEAPQGAAWGQPTDANNWGGPS
ncbi:hypothetical protein ABTJ88_19925, partial [Acinetobacter baumannii]